MGWWRHLGDALGIQKSNLRRLAGKSPISMEVFDEHIIYKWRTFQICIKGYFSKHGFNEQNRSEVEHDSVFSQSEDAHHYHLPLTPLGRQHLQAAAMSVPPQGFQLQLEGSRFQVWRCQRCGWRGYWAWKIRSPTQRTLTKLDPAIDGILWGQNDCISSYIISIYQYIILMAKQWTTLNNICFF